MEEQPKEKTAEEIQAELEEGTRMVTRNLLATATIDMILVWWPNHTTDYQIELRKGLTMLLEEPEHAEKAKAVLARLPLAGEAT